MDNLITISSPRTIIPYLFALDCDIPFTLIRETFNLVASTQLFSSIDSINGLNQTIRIRICADPETKLHHIVMEYISRTYCLKQSSGLLLH